MNMLDQRTKKKAREILLVVLKKINLTVKLIFHIFTEVIFFFNSFLSEKSKIGNLL